MARIAAYSFRELSQGSQACASVQSIAVVCCTGNVLLRQYVVQTVSNQRVHVLQLKRVAALCKLRDATPECHHTKPHPNWLAGKVHCVLYTRTVQVRQS